MTVKPNHQDPPFIARTLFEKFRPCRAPSEPKGIAYNFGKSCPRSSRSRMRIYANPRTAMLQIFLASPTRRLLLRFFAEIGPRVKLNCAGAPDLSGRICPQPLSNLAKKSADGVGEH